MVGFPMHNMNRWNKLESKDATHLKFFQIVYYLPCFHISVLERHYHFQIDTNLIFWHQKQQEFKIFCHKTWKPLGAIMIATGENFYPGEVFLEL